VNPAGASTVHDPVTDRGRRTKDKIVAAARSVFEQRGFNDARISDIAQAAGVSHGTVYVYFTSKDAILSAVITEVLTEAGEYLRVGAGDDPSERISEANLRYLQVYQRNARLLQVVEQAATADPDFAAMLDGFRTRHVARVADAIRRLQATEGAAGDLDPEVAAAALSAMVEGYARHARGFHADQVNATLSQLWVRGLGISETISGSPS